MGSVRIILAEVDKIVDDEKKLLSQIAPFYVEKYHSHKIAEDKKQELTAGYLLKKYLDISKDEQLKWNKHGKPYLVKGKPYFNLSHSGKYVVLAIADCEIGVDIERVRKCHAATVKKVFSKTQQKILEQSDEEKRDEVFTEMWTELESFLKLEGTGFGEKWEEIKKEKCSIQTMKVDEYFISCATERKVDIAIEKL